MLFNIPVRDLVAVHCLTGIHFLASKDKILFIILHNRPDKEYRLTVLMTRIHMCQQDPAKHPHPLNPPQALQGSTFRLP